MYHCSENNKILVFRELFIVYKFVKLFLVFNSYDSLSNIKYYVYIIFDNENYEKN